MSELPVGWVECLLEDLLGPLSDGKLLHQGWSPQCESVPAPDGEWGVLKTTAVQDGYFLEQENKKLPAALSPKPELEVKAGDLLMTCAGPRSRCGVICHVPKTRAKLIFSGKIYRFRPNSENVEPRFLTHLLRTAELKEKIDEIKTGISESGMNMTRDRFFSLPVRLAPHAEQTRIAVKLAELLAQVDTLKARIDGIPALLKRFRQSVLAAAVSGRLTEEWRASNPVSENAEEYISRVIQSRRKTPIVKFKEPVPPDLEKRELEVPEGWIVASVSSFAECLDSMRVPVKKELRKSGEGKYPYFGANGEVDRVDEYIFDDDLVLVTEDETFYGREKPIAYKYSGKCWVNNHVHALRAHDSVARDFLCYVLMHYDVIPWLTGTTGRAKLTQGALLSLPIQVPPSVEQTEIVHRVEQLFAFADQLEAKVNEAKTRIDRLTQSILAKAFRGELVPQDPSDEPASRLLARIQAQRAAAPKAKRGRNKVV